MTTYEKAIDAGRKTGVIGRENYWLFIRKDNPDDCVVLGQGEESVDRIPGYIGYFVEDDTRLPGIMLCYERARRRGFRK